MKRNLLLLVAIFIAGSMSAQLYVGARVGYGFGAQKYAVGFTQTDDYKENIWGSMGQGLPMGLKVGYYFNDNLGIELGINYWIGAEQTAADVTSTVAPGMVYTNKTTAKSSQLRMMPQLVYKSDMGIYGRFGMVIPVSGSTIVTSTEVMPGAAGPITTEAEKQYKGSFAIGFAGAFGYAYELSDNMHLFGEMEYISLTIKGKSSEVTKYSVNGSDMLSAMTTIQKETNYVDKLDKTSNNSKYNSTPDASKPLDDLRTSTVYSSLRFNVGITMAF
jgi:opacity protein-like surface antigen